MNTGQKSDEKWVEEIDKNPKFHTDKGKKLMFTLKFSTSNSAFEGSPTKELEEIIRILERVPEEIGGGAREGYIRDINGNKIGTWKLT